MSNFTNVSVPIQTTEKGIRFKKWYDEVRNLLDGKDEVQQKKAVLANQEFVRGIGNPRSSGSDIGSIETRAGGPSPASVHVDAILSTFSVMYANDEYIGERCMPAVPVSKRSDIYFVYPKREALAFPDDAISSGGKSNELDSSRTTDNYSVKDYGFQHGLDLETIANQDAPLNEMLDMLELLNEGIAFKREKRIAAIVQASANYGGNTAAAATKWDNAGGTIFTDIQAADAALWHGHTPTRKIAVTTLDNWNSCIVNNPLVLDRIKYTQKGIITTDLIASAFGLADLLIARPREDTANSGQTASYARMWTTDFFAILQVATRPTTRSLHFGSTFRSNGDPFTASWQNPAIGKRGGISSRVAVSEDHKVVAGDAAFFISDVKT